jgi:hypothetical protein
VLVEWSARACLLVPGLCAAAAAADAAAAAAAAVETVTSLATSVVVNCDVTATDDVWYETLRL